MRKLGDLRKGLKFCLTVVFVNFIFLLGLTCIVSAQSAGAPEGSYKKTCKNINYNPSDDRITSAFCKDFNQNYKVTYLDNAKQCKDNGGDITNCNGSLDCTGIGIPRGSYRDSCFCCKMVGNTLSCYCRDSRGTPHFTTLQNANNYNRIWNDNGKLKGRN